MEKLKELPEPMPILTLKGWWWKKYFKHYREQQQIMQDVVNYAYLKNKPLMMETIIDKLTN